MPAARFLRSSPSYSSARPADFLAATFKVYLPKSDEAIQQVVAKVRSVRTRGSETVLLVEDQTGLRQLAKLMLERDGYRVWSAETAARALEISEGYAEAIHLLVTDVVLPGMNGRVLAKCLTERRPEVKVLFVSGYAENAIAHLGELGPGTSFLEKPFTPETLSEKVRAILDRTL